MIEKHVVEAIRQLRKGEKIGRRGTPVISIWDMKPKWEKWGTAWEYTGSDGVPFPENGKMVVPCLIRLAYFRTSDGRVCQLAYVVKDEVVGPIGSVDTEYAIRTFERETAIFPRSIA